MHVYRAADLNEAVELATALKNQGRYCWFRGQRQNWALKSSFLRFPPRTTSTSYIALRGTSAG